MTEYYVCFWCGAICKFPSSEDKNFRYCHNERCLAPHETLMVCTNFKEAKQLSCCLKARNKYIEERIYDAIRSNIHYG